MIDYSHYPPLVERGDLSGLVDSVTDAQIEEVADDVRGECGWHIAPQVDDDVLVVDSDGSTVLSLPSLHITEPTSVVDRDGNEITDYEWSEIGQLTRAAGWPVGYRAVTVTVTHGLPAAPLALRSVLTEMLNTRGVAIPGQGPVKSVGNDGATIAYAVPTPAAPAVLRRYSIR